MNIKKNIFNIVLITILTTVFIFSNIEQVHGINFYHEEIKNSEIFLNQTINEAYNGRLRIYIVEIESRWSNSDNEPFHFGFLDFATDINLSITLSQIFSDSVIWNASDADYENILKDNIMTIAVVYNPESQLRRIEMMPPNEDILYDAYPVDAAAATTPEKIGYNTIQNGFTHTVFCEDATASFCGACPSASEALQSIYMSKNYPFYYVEMIFENEKSLPRYNNYFTTGIAMFPTCFFDGGYVYEVGGGVSCESRYRTAIEKCGVYEAHGLNLSVYLDWIGDGVIKINFSITNLGKLNYPPTIPIISGSKSGKTGHEYNYKFVSTDPNNDNILYYIDWGDETNSSWLGPYNSGEESSDSHIWTRQGTYEIKIKAKDIFDVESEWSNPFVVTMPKNKTFSLLSRLLEENHFLFKIPGRCYFD